jgi:SAM-dependent methyltransferase
MSDLLQRIGERVDHYNRQDTDHHGWVFHKERNTQTILHIVNEVERIKPKEVLVIGGISLIDWVIKDLDLCPGVVFQFSDDFDLRFPFPLESDRYDLLINTEVLEHIKDQRDTKRDILNYSGVINFFTECNRILKKGGTMLFSTPNASSRKSIIRMLLGKPPCIYLFHVREYTPLEIIYFMNTYHFTIDKIETMEIYNSDEDSGPEYQFGSITNADTFRIVDEILDKYGFDKTLRGDAILVHCHK